MEWTQLQYLCRKYGASLLVNKTYKGVFSKEEKAGSLAFYKSGKKNKLSKLLHEALLQNQDEGVANHACNFYSELPFLSEHTASSTFKNKAIYLLLIGFFYCCLSMFYGVFVLPRFAELITIFSENTYQYQPWYIDYWFFITLLVFLLSLFFIAAIWLYSRLISVSTLNIQSRFYRFSVPKTIKDEYHQLISILILPLEKTNHFKVDAHKPLKKHLYSVSSDGLDLTSEMKILLKKKHERLIHLCTRSMKKIMILYAVVVLLSIFLFLKSAYEPLFVFGSMS